MSKRRRPTTRRKSDNKNGLSWLKPIHLIIVVVIGAFAVMGNIYQAGRGSAYKEAKDQVQDIILEQHDEGIKENSHAIRENLDDIDEIKLDVKTQVKLAERDHGDSTVKAARIKALEEINNNKK